MRRLAILLVAVSLSSCVPATTPPTVEPTTTTVQETTSTSVVTSTTVTQPETTTTTIPPTTTTTLGRPEWLGTQPLPLLPDGTAQVLPTPPELVDRRLPTPDLLPPPSGDEFEFTIQPIPADVLVRSTWRDGCPQNPENLRYLTVSFYGFDGLAHNGEIIVDAGETEDIVGVFEQIHAERFPIEEMRVISREELEAPGTGDGNVTTGFVCRPVVYSTSWSEHAYGRAIDINPFHNPYRRGERVVPELASAYLDRDDVRPGMIANGDVVTRAFAEIGWGWGGNWRTADDWMHFSSSGR
jgi:hypothetical protein